MVARFEDPDGVAAALRSESYLADHGLSVALFLALSMGRPLLLEGEPGVGKTEVARALARALEAELIRLQCYEGIDAANERAPVLLVEELDRAEEEFEAYLF